jgi:hypothetical protein
MKRDNTPLIVFLGTLVLLGLLAYAIYNGNPWEGFKKQIESSKASGRAH